MKMRKTILLAAALFASAATPACAAPPEVRTSAGALRGVEQGAVDAFLGVPYAAPPVGEGRWRAPAPVRHWQGVRDAWRFGPACMQSIAGSWGPYTEEFIAPAPVSEDCLTLNLWRPAGAHGRLPVLVFIHGGAFSGGAGHVPAYDGAKLAARGAVVITINYRVGVFGFLAHPALSAESPLHVSGNYGLLDQIAALRWVRANVARFHGDPRNVTVAGGSAGAASVNDLQVSPVAKGLFQRAASFSGASMAIDLPSLADGEAVGRELARRLGADDAASLRSIPADRLLAATRVVPSGNSAPRLVYVPHRDGKVVPLDPDRGDARVITPVPLLTGFNAEEMIDPSVRTPADFERHVRARYGDFADRLLALYPHASDAEAAQSNVQLARDRYMTGLVLWGRARAASVATPVYLYLHDQPFPPAPGGPGFGAFHSSQLVYLFGNLGLGGRRFTAADEAVSREWQDRMLAFMRSGDPSLAGQPWQRADAGTSAVNAIGATSGSRPAVSSPERFEALRAFAAAGGKPGLM